LSVICSKSAELWDGDVGTICVQILVNFNVNDLFDVCSDLGDDLWDDSALQEWDEYTGNSRDESTSKGDLNLRWINGDIVFLHRDFCSCLATNCLGAQIDFNIEAQIVHLDSDLTTYSDPVLVYEVGGDGG